MGSGECHSHLCRADWPETRVHLHHLSEGLYTAAGPAREERRLTVAAAASNTSQLLDKKIVVPNNQYACTVLYNCAGDISVDLERDYIRFQEWACSYIL